MGDAIKYTQKLCFEFQNVTPYALLIIESLVLFNNLMIVDDEYFQQIFGFIMGIYVIPILTNIYMALLENELKDKCKTDPKLI